MSIIAFVLSIFGILLFAVPLAIWGLQRTSDRQRRSRGFAIAALILSGLWFLVIVVITVNSSAIIAALQETEAPSPQTTSAAIPAIPAAEPSTPAETQTPAQPSAKQPTGPLRKQKQVYLDDLKVGDCFKDGTNPNGFKVSRVDCRVAHTDELILRKQLPNSAKYPGDEAMETADDAWCQAAFTKYVGVPPEDSELVFLSLPPDREGWKLGDRLVLCSAGTGESSTVTYRGWYKTAQA